MKLWIYMIFCYFSFLVFGCAAQPPFDENGEPSTTTQPAIPIEHKEELPHPKNKTAPCVLKTEDNNITIITLKNYPPLKFLWIKANHGIEIGLKSDQAKDFLRQAYALLPPNSSPIVPFIFRAVSDNPRLKAVAGFWIQEKTINPQLYKDLISDEDASVIRVSYEDTQQIIGKLNQLCKDKAKFSLPKEEQFVHLAREAYDPVTDGNLIACQELKGQEPYGVKQVFGHNWQLTNSFCRALDPYNSDSTRACDSEQYYVKKGGSIESRDATECMPEYRAESISDMREPNTTFRLVLKPYSTSKE